jgi:hypothetical protein
MADWAVIHFEGDDWHLTWHSTRAAAERVALERATETRKVFLAEERFETNVEMTRKLVPVPATR